LCCLVTVCACVGIGVEQFVAHKIKAADHSWFPMNQAMSLDYKEEETSLEENVEKLLSATKQLQGTMNKDLGKIKADIQTLYQVP
jgi:cytochrome c556